MFQNTHRKAKRVKKKRITVASCFWSGDIRYWNWNFDQDFSVCCPKSETDGSTEWSLLICSSESSVIHIPENKIVQDVGPRIRAKTMEGGITSSTSKTGLDLLVIVKNLAQWSAFNVISHRKTASAGSRPLFKWKSHWRF